MNFSPIRILLTLVKLFLLLVVIAMVMFQIPELRYDFGTKTPVRIQSPDELSLNRFAVSTFASVKGKGDFTKAATFTKYGVTYTYFLLEGYSTTIVVRTIEAVSEQWDGVNWHVGRLRPFLRMPFSRRVRAGFRQHFDLEIPDDAMFLARDDVPRISAWSIGAVIFAGVLWCTLVYFFFIRGCRKRRKTPA